MLNLRLSACRGADAAPTTKPAPTIVLPAVLEPYEQTDLYAKTSGYVAAVLADIGDSVKAGQILARIDQPELLRDLAEAQATLIAKSKLLEAADATVQQSKQAVEVAKRNVVRYQAEAELQDATLKRQQELASGKAITDQQLDDARSKAAIARADAEIAGAKVLAAQADEKGSEAARGVAAAQADVAKEQVSKIEVLIHYLSIAAPYDGVVVRRMVNVGDLTQPAGSGRAAPLFTVQQRDKLRVRCDAPESAALGLSVGDAASIKLVAQNQTITGKVSRTAGSLDLQSRTMRVEIDLANDQKKYLPGTYAQVTLTVGTPPATNPSK